MATLIPNANLPFRQWPRGVHGRQNTDRSVRSLTPDYTLQDAPTQDTSNPSMKETQKSQDGPYDEGSGDHGFGTAVRENFLHSQGFGKVELREEECLEVLALSHPNWKKWLILMIVALVQVSMNLNCSIYSSAVPLIAEHFDIREYTARLGQMIFLVSYAFGSELWAPWSEEWGRWRLMQLSLLLVNIWQIPCFLATNFSTILAGRFFGGLCSAGGSVTLGIVADMWEPHDQQFAVAFIVLSSVAGSVFGPIIGGFMQVHLDWQFNFYVQIALGVFVQILHYYFVPETRSTIVVTKEAQRRRKICESNLYGPCELRKSSLTVREVLKIWMRPFKMFFTEPIVLFLSLLSGFSDALIFSFLESFPLVFRKWGFSIEQQGLVFISINLGYIFAYFSFFPFIYQHKKLWLKDPARITPESRLYWLLFTAPLEVIGLFGFAWTCSGPPIHWIIPVIFAMFIAIANYCIYMATIDYMVASYGEFSASATGGNAFARDILAGVAAVYSTPLYNHFRTNNGRYKHQLASTVLGVISIVVTAPIYIFYWKGPVIRSRSKLALSIEQDRIVRADRRTQVTSRTGSYADIEFKNFGDIPPDGRQPSPNSA